MSENTKSYKENMQIVFRSFLQFYKIMENEKRNPKEWISKLDKQGANTIEILLTWPIWFQKFKEGFYIFQKSKFNF